MTPALALARVRSVLSGDGVLRVSTSGSTGSPTSVELSAAALRASAAASAARLGAIGRWVLVLPTDHIAGLQVLVRSELAAGQGVAKPLVSGAPSDLCDLISQAHAIDDAPVFLSLVPTMLRRALADPDSARALASCRAVLVGGGPCPNDLIEQARSAGINPVRTYGMTETAGGCVYDGLPLNGVELRIAEPDSNGSGRIEISGPMLANGLGPWLRTNDLGRLDDAGRLVVLGRVDDVIVTGGVNVHPAPVEAALSEALNGAEVCVIGVPDPEWGQAVVAVVAGDRPAAELEIARRRVASQLGGPSAPKRIVQVPEFPLLPSGKPDRLRLRAALSGDDGASR